MYHLQNFSCRTRKKIAVWIINPGRYNNFQIDFNGRMWGYEPQTIGLRNNTNSGNFLSSSATVNFKRRYSSRNKPQRVLQILRSSASIFKVHYLLSSLRSSSGCLRLLPRLSVPYMHPQITCFRNQFPRKMWPKSSLSSFILLYVGCSLPPRLHVTLLTLWYGRRNKFPQSFRSSSCLVNKVRNYLR